MPRNDDTSTGDQHVITDDDACLVGPDCPICRVHRENRHAAVLRDLVHRLARCSLAEVEMIQTYAIAIERTRE